MSEILGESIKAPIVLRIRVCTFILEQIMIDQANFILNMPTLRGHGGGLLYLN